MPVPDPLYYQSLPAINNDLSHLRVLSILHYVWGGLAMLFSCIFIIYIVLGFVMASGAMNMSTPVPTVVGSSVPTSAPSGVAFTRSVTGPANPPPRIGYIFVGFGTCGVIVGWAIGFCTIISGRKMAVRKSRIFSMVIAGINCISFPLGTTLGVFTIIVLSKQSVKELYAS